MRERAEPVVAFTIIALNTWPRGSDSCNTVATKDSFRECVCVCLWSGCLNVFASVGAGEQEWWTLLLPLLLLLLLLLKCPDDDFYTIRAQLQLLNDEISRLESEEKNR